MPKTYKFINEQKGIGKNSGKPYHMVKLHDPETYQNHQISADTTKILAPFGLTAGQTVEIDVALETPYDRTNPVLVGLRVVNAK